MIFWSSWWSTEVQKYNLPENKIKSDSFGNPKDSRGPAYKKIYGDRSWEVDALNPLVLDQIVKDEIESVIDKDLYFAMREKEGQEQEELYGIANQVKEMYNWLDQIIYFLLFYFHICHHFFAPCASGSSLILSRLFSWIKLLK